MVREAGSPVLNSDFSRAGSLPQHHTHPVGARLLAMVVNDNAGNLTPPTDFAVQLVLGKVDVLALFNVVLE